MIVKLLVTADININEGKTPPDDELRASVLKAIDNAVALGADTGFQHPLSNVASISIESVILPDEEQPEEGEAFLSWVEAAEHIPAGKMWVPRIIYDQREIAWFWRDARSDDGWHGPFADREVAAMDACKQNAFLPRIASS